MIEKGCFSQKFTVVCYIAAIFFASLTSTAVSMAVPSDSEVYLYLSYLLPQLCYIITVALLGVVKQIPFGLFLSGKDIKPLPYLFALLIGVGLFFFALLPNTFVQSFLTTSGSSATVKVPDFTNGWDYVWCTLVLCLLPAVGEELLYRKVFCAGMKGVNPVITVLLGGLLFSFSHFNLAQTLHQFVLGAVLCFLYIRTENITLTMLVHALNNALALFLTQITGEEMWESMSALGIACGVGAVLVAIGIYLVFRFCPANKNIEKKSTERATLYMVAVVGLLWAVVAVVGYMG